MLKGLSISFKLCINGNLEIDVNLEGVVLMSSIGLLIHGFMVGSGYCGMVFCLKQDNILCITSDLLI